MAGKPQPPIEPASACTMEFQKRVETLAALSVAGGRRLPGRMVIRAWA
jgi:hypothetical protein